MLAQALLRIVAALSDVSCLAHNVYHEARGEPRAGQVSVAWVTMNRVRSPRFPGTVCGVVHQHAQFSWTLAPGPVRYDLAWYRSVGVALAVYAGLERPRFGGRAVFYHARRVNPRWTKAMTVVGSVGHHVFYERKRM